MIFSRPLPLRPYHALWLLLLFVIASGCPEQKPAVVKNESAKQKLPLVLLVVDDPKLGDAIAREWRARTEEEIVVRAASTGDIGKASRLPADAIIFPTGMIGSLAERGLIGPLDSASLESADFNYRDILDQIRLREMKWGDKTFAAPLGSPQLLLGYRADIFEKSRLTPPKTWAEYQRAVEKLNDRMALGDLVSGDGQPSFASIEPLAEGWGGQLLLARAAAYAMHRDQVSPLFRFETMTPLIDQSPYRRALEELVTAAKKAGFAGERMTPQAALTELRAGRCAMALTWPSAELVDSSNQSAEATVRFAMLPGATEAYRFATKSWEKRGEEDSVHVPLLAISGRMAAISATSAEPRRAESLVLWLAGSDVSQQVAPHSSSTTLFRQSQLANSSRWTGGLPAEASRQYAETLAQTLRLPRSFPGLTLPGRDRYLAALDKAVEQALDGKLADDVLAEAAKQWGEITAELDVNKQRRANARSLGQATP
jgi:ABC-type glycerol-3-phosphate transport system substrate-binding protein